MISGGLLKLLCNATHHHFTHSKFEFISIIQNNVQPWIEVGPVFVCIFFRGICELKTLLFLD